MDTNQPSNTLSRRKFVKIGATGAATLFILPALSGCGSENGEAQTDEAEGGAGAQQKTATLAFRGGTVKAHNHSIYKKLGIENRSQVLLKYTDYLERSAQEARLFC